MASTACPEQENIQGGRVQTQTHRYWSHARITDVDDEGEIRALVSAALADPSVDLAVPLGMSLAFREGLRRTILTTLFRGDYHPAVGDVPGSLTYRDGDEVRMVKLSPESELLLSAHLAR
ncbi:hypothetical protein [Streptomyces chrestomyceticus]|uniref:hypothetical protein n=1 Tax=Streptomyces chrestomyceticus TaxID=68185 RepID=UPI0035A884C9